MNMLINKFWIHCRFFLPPFLYKGYIYILSLSFFLSGEMKRERERRKFGMKTRAREKSREEWSTKCETSHRRPGCSPMIIVSICVHKERFFFIPPLFVSSSFFLLHHELGSSLIALITLMGNADIDIIMIPHKVQYNNIFFCSIISTRFEPSRFTSYIRNWRLFLFCFPFPDYLASILHLSYFLLKMIFDRMYK